MSHEATNWAFKVEGLKPGPKVVLLYLADRHNPDYGCFPRQDSLASACNVSRASLNNHLDLLEELGLIRREQRIDKRTNRQRATRYHFAFEESFDPSPASGQCDVEKPCPDSGHGVVDKPVDMSSEPCPSFDEKPCPEFGHITSKFEPVRTVEAVGGQEMTSADRSALVNELAAVRRMRDAASGLAVEQLDQQVVALEQRLGISAAPANDEAAA